MARIILEQSKCILCMLCVDYCPVNVFSIRGDKIMIDEAKCIECYACKPLCPVHAIEILD
ncbi:indolepyruvate ferredoxin oxidoreductase subunit alpha [Desulfurococcus amylolyticus]|uniref:indolepyruvate ferredoxin oxidoreductase subunit alpha n=1 Tax=Desulfurococcus TaxID=2273 RepID=UPI000324E1C1|nr:4Fe-4S binding protein [Desulfurococcus amylolyticus]